MTKKTDERIDKFVSDCIDLLEAYLANEMISKINPPGTVGSIGGALKTLAEGVEAYKKAVE